MLNGLFNTAVFLQEDMVIMKEYRAAQNFTDYGLPDYQNGTQVITQTDLNKAIMVR